MFKRRLKAIIVFGFLSEALLGLYTDVYGDMETLWDRYQDYRQERAEMDAMIHRLATSAIELRRLDLELRTQIISIIDQELTKAESLSDGI